MDVREKLVELANDVLRYLPWGEIQKDTAEQIADRMMDHGVTVQEWISVKDRLPERNEDGTLNAVLVTNGRIQHIAYFAKDEFYFTENGEMKEPMFYEVTHWQHLPQPPKGE